ncbi:MAG TPA: hypothetical protein DCP73_00910 [Chloroflexi bacterium]|jgi:ABC-2 type transport system permease protein|nr:hypothetical protein [Chloroflexota bacterium]
MTEWVDMYRAQLATTFATQLQYRAVLVIWLLGLILSPVISLVVWMTVAASGGGQAGGFTAPEFAAYFLTLMVVNHLTFTWIAWDFEYRVRNGQLSGLLLRPTDPIHIDIADNVTYKTITVAIVIPTVIVLGAVFEPAVTITPVTVLAFIPALALAAVLRFLVEYILAMVAFWTTRVSAINDLYYVPLFFFSGQLVPLSLLPDTVQLIGLALPFRWMLSFPVEVILGRVQAGDLITGYGAQIGWIAIAMVARVVVWRAGLRRYAAVGA